MPFDDGKYNTPARAGDVGWSAFLAHIALNALSEAIAKIAQKADVDVSDELGRAKKEIDALNAEFDELTGWKPS